MLDIPKLSGLRMLSPPPPPHGIARSEIPETRKKELEMWRTWKKDPSPENLDPLLNSFKPMIMKTVSTYQKAPIPPSVLEASAQQSVVSALKTYDPAKGTLSSHVGNHLKKVYHTVAVHQNIGRIPDARAARIGDYLRARDELMQELGRPPDADTLARKLGPRWSSREVAMMEAELRKDLLASHTLEPDVFHQEETTRERDVMRYIYYELTPEEKTVFDYTLGLHGKPRLDAKDIAREMNTSRASITRTRQRIDQKIAEAMKET